jgi:glycosyltransferase involved in cell wall biosynthesis
VKVLLLTNMYPTDSSPYYGIFIKEQVDQLRGSNQLDDISVFNVGDRKGMLGKYVTSLPSLFRFILSYRPDIIHVHFGFTFLLLMPIFPILKLTSIKIITTFHGGDLINSLAKSCWKSKIVVLISKLAARLSDKNIAVSREIFEQFNESKNNYYLPCGVDELFYNDISFSRKRVIIFPSDPSRAEKNYPMFKRITARLKSDDFEFKIENLSGLTRRQVRDKLKSSFCMLLTSTHEGSPQCIKEAIVCDLPVISTNVGDVSFLLNNLPNCYVSNDEFQLYLKIKKLFSNVENTMKYEENVKKQFDGRLVAKKILDIYIR